LLDKYKKESVIIYCFSRKETEKIAEDLKLNNFNARPYHAGLNVGQRKLTQELFVKDEVNIIVATIAFGMGIDKPDVRLVVHYTYPKTLEGYYQEIGRAGRDGLPSECVMFYTYADTRKHQFFINQISDSQLRSRAEEKLSEVLSFGELTTCRKKYLLQYFGEELEQDNCQSCDVCTTETEMFDATTVIQKILSAVVRTQNRFGKNYIIDLLLGKKIQKILRNNHHELSVFGIVQNFGVNDLGQIINQLTNLNFLLKTEGQYPTLAITQKGADFLQNKQKLELPRPKIEPIVRQGIKKGDLDYNKEMFTILKTLRKGMADEANVPPFVIFGDKSLQEMAYYFPTDKNSFLQINGVGAKKLEQLGDLFLDAINNFAKQHEITPKNISQGKKEPRTIVTKQPNLQYYDETKHLLIKKVSVERIAKRQDLKSSTIIDHIEKLLDAGCELDLEYLKLPVDRYNIMKKAFEECGDERLKPVFEYLKGKYHYDELRLVRVLRRA